MMQTYHHIFPSSNIELLVVKKKGRVSWQKEKFFGKVATLSGRATTSLKSYKIKSALFNKETHPTRTPLYKVMPVLKEEKQKPARSNLGKIIFEKIVTLLMSCNLFS